MAKAKKIRGLEAAANARSNLRDIFAVRIEELWDWEQYLDDQDHVRELHDMRIAAKRLRYLFEFFEPCFGDDLTQELVLFKQLQDYLGEIHDCDAWADYLRRRLLDAVDEVKDACEALDEFDGAHPDLKSGSEDLADMLQEGPAPGLAQFIAEISGRRSRLYAELLEFWGELTRSRFRDRLEALVDAAATGGDDPPGDPDD